MQALVTPLMTPKCWKMPYTARLSSQAEQKGRQLLEECQRGDIDIEAVKLLVDSGAALDLQARCGISVCYLRSL